MIYASLFQFVPIHVLFHVPIQTIKLRTALEETQYIVGAEWRYASRGPLPDSERPERRCRLAPSYSVDDTRGQEYESLDIQILQA